MLTVALLIVIISLVLFHNFYWKRRNLPPGPAPLPLIGNALQMAYYDSYKCFFKFAEDYGDVHTLWFGNTPMVMISSAEKIQQYFIKNGEALSGRMKHSPIFHDLTRDGKYGIVFTDGELWRETRRFTLRVLRDFGMGKNLMQERILNEIDWLLKKIKEDIQTGEHDVNGIDIKNHIDLTVGSVINSVVYGFGLSNKNRQAEFFEQKKRFQKVIDSMDSPIFRVLLFADNSLVFKLPGISGTLKKMKQDFQPFRDAISDQVDQHVRDLVEDTEPTDFIDAFLKEKKVQEAKGKASDMFTKHQLTITTMDLWLAGHHTTSVTINWGICFLASHIDIQDRLHAELNREIGSDQFVTMSDKPKLPFTNAVIMEVQRHANIVPVNIPHRLLEPVTVDGYTLPTDTYVVAHIGPAMHQTPLFPEPTIFNPGRYLDENGNFSPLSEVMPFGIGKRSCAGEALARAELFLIMANFFNQFRVTLPKGQKLDFKRRGIARDPPTYKVFIETKW